MRPEEGTTSLGALGRPSRGEPTGKEPLREGDLQASDTGLSERKTSQEGGDKRAARTKEKSMYAETNQFHEG